MSRATEANAVGPAAQPGFWPQTQFWIGTSYEHNAFDQMSPKMILLCIAQASQAFYRSNLIAHQYFLIYKWRT